jgi:hypothetical protein
LRPSRVGKCVLPPRLMPCCCWRARSASSVRRRSVDVGLRLPPSLDAPFCGSLKADVAQDVIAQAICIQVTGVALNLEPSAEEAANYLEGMKQPHGLPSLKHGRRKATITAKRCEWPFLTRA